MSVHKRSNYLVDRPFQLKGTALLVGLTLFVAVLLGVLLVRTSSEAVSIGREAVDIGVSANGASNEAIKQAELLNKRLEMETILKLGDKPDVVDQLKKANELETTKLKKQADTLRLEGEKLSRQRDALERTRANLLYGVSGGIAALVLLVGFAGIFFTHRVAGPIHRMRALFREVGDGKFSPYRPLRKGDELQEFFTEFSALVEKLKGRQKEEIDRLDAALAKAEKAGVSDASLYDLRAVRDAMEKSLEHKPSEMRIQT